VSWFEKESNRAWLYRVLLAVSAALVVFGVLSEEETAALIAIAAAALLGNGMAVSNTSTKPKPVKKAAKKRTAGG
jgi:hypothetical protein